MSPLGRSLQALAICLLTQSVAFAGEITHRCTIQLKSTRPTPQLANITIPSFPSHLGQLKNVSVSVDRAFDSVLQCENWAFMDVIAECRLDEVLSLRVKNGIEIGSTQAGVTQFVQFQAYDGSTDWSGPSGLTLPLRDKARDSYSPAPTSRWTDATQRQRVELEAQYLAVASASPGSPFLTSQYSSSVMATISVTYTY